LNDPLEEGVKIYTNEVVCPWGGASKEPQNQKLRKINLFHVMVQVNVNYVYL
jgi:hypothetical protein